MKLALFVLGALLLVVTTLWVLDAEPPIRTLTTSEIELESAPRRTARPELSVREPESPRAEPLVLEARSTPEERSAATPGRPVPNVTAILDTIEVREPATLSDPGGPTRDATVAAFLAAAAESLSAVEDANLVTLLRQMREKSALPDGPFTAEYEDGTPKEQGTLLNQRRVGPWTAWHPNGERSMEATYAAGELHGVYTEWHESGEKRITGDHVYGRREGPWTQWRADGSLEKTESYLNGMLDGRVVEYHANGKKRSDAFYVFGDRHLAFRAWHANGELETLGNYHYGLQHGSWEVRTPEGDLIPEQSGSYDLGERVNG